MTMAHSFDTYDAATRMKKAGFDEGKVEVLLTLLKETSRDDHLVTKEYLDHRLDHFENRLIQLEQRMVIKIGGLIVATGAVLSLIARYLPPVAG